VKSEFHARFCERPQGKFLRPTHQRAKELITYPNFWKQFYRKFPQYHEATITAREFEPGERVEVDNAGDPIEWYQIKSGEILSRADGY
jgi:hypothetical protein